MTFEAPTPPPTFSAGARRTTNRLAIASVVAGGIGVVITIFIPSILAVIFGHMSLNQIRATGEEGRGLAIAGLVLGYLMIAVSFALFLLMFFIFKTTRITD